MQISAQLTAKLIVSVAAFHTVTMCVKNDDAVLVVTDITVFSVAQLGTAVTAAAAAAHDVANAAVLAVPAVVVDSAGAGLAETEAVALLVLQAVNTAGMALNNKEATSDAEKWPQFLVSFKIRTETVSSTVLVDFRLFLLRKILNHSMQTESIPLSK